MTSLQSSQGIEISALLQKRTSSESPLDPKRALPGIRRRTPPFQQNCNSEHLSYGFALTTTLGCRSRAVDWIMIRILQDQENGHRNNCTSRFRVRDRRYRGQNLRMAPGRSIWPIHRSTFGPKWVTGVAEKAARLRTLRHSVCMFLGCLTSTLAFPF